MSVFDFDKLTDRRGTLSLKWDVAEHELPMWVADMDFETAPCITRALQKRLDEKIFGYMILPDAWYEAYQGWWEKHHGFSVQKEWLIFTTGVIPAISTAVRKFTTPAERIIVQTPVYNMFFNSIVNNGRRILENPLRFVDGEYSMDFEDLEEKMKDPQTTMMILCNPANPVGKIWDRESLEKVGELAKKHHVLVFSDEIHCDLTAPGKGYVPFASVSDICRDNSITAVAPTKTFGIPGLQSAAVIVPEEGLRQRMNRALNTDEVAEPGSFAVDAAVAGFSEEGWQWLCEARSYIEENKQYVIEALGRQVPGIQCISQDATYLMWLDVSAYTKDSEALARAIQKETGLFLSAGQIYGGDGNTHLRLNVACSRERVADGVSRLVAYFSRQKAQDAVE
ncbi:MAG: pyridoxal phosphate-dependent aminotransferase [Lachnospiraceae bacterium]|nr:pyridoxal phosphate-dependent aminotransferase [Lachnospiraceae bacterium]